MSILLIETQTKKYAKAYNALTASITEMEKEIESVKNKYLPEIKTGVIKLKAANKELYDTIDANKDFFVKPKTQIYHNIRVGLSKGKGKKEFDEAKTIKLIKKNFPYKVKQLIKVEEKVISKSLDKLSVSDLKKIGVNIIEAQDEIVIRPVDSEIRKAIDKIIKEINNEENE